MCVCFPLSTTVLSTTVQYYSTKYYSTKYYSTVQYSTTVQYHSKGVTSRVVAENPPTHVSQTFFPSICTLLAVK